MTATATSRPGLARGKRHSVYDDDGPSLNRNVNDDGCGDIYVSGTYHVDVDSTERSLSLYFSLSISLSLFSLYRSISLSLSLSLSCLFL